MFNAGGEKALNFVFLIRNQSEVVGKLEYLLNELYGLNHSVKIILQGRGELREDNQYCDVIVERKLNFRQIVKKYRSTIQNSDYFIVSDLDSIEGSDLAEFSEDAVVYDTSKVIFKGNKFEVASTPMESVRKLNSARLNGCNAFKLFLKMLLTKFGI